MLQAIERAAFTAMHLKLAVIVRTQNSR